MQRHRDTEPAARENRVSVFDGLEKAGLAGEDIAQIAGVTPPTVSKWRCGRARLPARILVFLTLVLANRIDEMEALADRPRGWGTPDGSAVVAARDLLGHQERLNRLLPADEDYRKRRPILVPGENERLLIPENLLTHNIDLQGIEDPLPLAMMATRDPEAPMALAAAARLCPLAGKRRLISGVAEIVSDASRHELVKEALKYVDDNAFAPESIAHVRRHTSRFIVQTRQQYTAALRDNLHALLEGSIAPRQFVREFFELTEAGNMRHDIRQKLVISLLLSGNVRPSVKFMMLENLDRMPHPGRMAVVSAVLKAEPTRHTEIIKEELRYIVTQQNLLRDVH